MINKAVIFMKKGFKRIICSALSVAAVIAGAGTVAGAVCLAPSVASADEIDDLIKQREELEKQQKELEEQKKKTEEEKQKTEKEVKELEDQLKKLIDEINELDKQLSELMGEIFEVNTQLDEQINKQDKQYSEMSLRIRYMYEDSNTSISEALMSSKSMDGVLNAAEYFQRIYSYDRARLEEIKDTREQIEDLKAKLEEEFEKVKKAEEEISAKRAEVAKIAEEKKDKIAALDSDLAQTITSIADTEQAQKDTNEALNEAVKARIAALGSADAAQLIEFAKKAREAADGYNAAAPANVVADIAANNKGTFPANAGWCAAWVSGVYNAAGVMPPHGNAIDYWNKWQSTGSTSMTDIPVGAAVISSGAGYDGSVYGHIGIHIGGGIVANNIGYCKIETIESFAASATATCQGHRGYIGWVWPNGNVLSAK